MRVVIEATELGLSFGSMNGVSRCIFHLIDALAQIDTSNEYVVFFNSFRRRGLRRPALRGGAPAPGRGAAGRAWAAAPRAGAPAAWPARCGAHLRARAEPRAPVEDLADLVAEFGFVHCGCRTLPPYSTMPRALSADPNVRAAREQCVFTLPSEHPMAIAVSATSSSSQ